MKIAFLILCHKKPNQINKLINTLNDKDVSFFMHVDKKSDISSKINKYDNVFFVENTKRVDVKWGDLSMISATQNLIEESLNCDVKFDYYWLLSGEDFPIKKIDEIKSFLSANKGKNFINIIDKNSGEYKKLRKRNDLYYPKWMMKRDKIAIIFKFAYMFMTGGLSKTIFLKRKSEIEFYYGSQWWVFTYDCINYIYNELNQSNLLQFYRNSLVPDESVYQTVFMNSEYAKTKADKLTYVYWEKNSNHPKTFRMEDYEELMSNDKYMARKFDENIDNDIIDALSGILTK